MSGEASRSRILVGACVLAGLLPVAPVLAWSFGLGSFAAWFWGASVPASCALVAIGIAWSKNARIRTVLVAGTLGGIAGTLGYDLFRAPLAAITGRRLFAPIDSYGVLLTGADSSGPWTSVAGWTMHFMNGIGFGIAYAAVAAGRRWWWGVAWGMMLETATIVTPYAAFYGITDPEVVVMAYAAHVFYGLPLGRIVEDAEGAARRATHVLRWPATLALAALAVTLLLLFKPWSTPRSVAAAREVAAGPSAVIERGRFVPEWLRTSAEGCVTLRNDDAVPYRIVAARGAPTLGPGQRSSVCFAGEGVKRVPASAAPYSGGFVILDPAKDD